MRTTRISLIGSAALALTALAACGRKAPTTASSDLSRDLALSSGDGLALASQQGEKSYALTEIAPTAKPEAAKSVKPSAGPKAVHSPRPTVHAAPERASAPEKSPAPEVETTASAPDPTPTEAPTTVDAAPAVPRPVAVPVATSGDGGQTAGSSNGGSTMGTIIGGILGAVIRGGSVDGDNCEIPGEGRHGGRRGGGVYSPNPNGGRGTWGRPGGIGTGRIPINP